MQPQSNGAITEQADTEMKVAGNGEVEATEQNGHAGVAVDGAVSSSSDQQSAVYAEDASVVDLASPLTAANGVLTRGGWW